MNISDLIFIGLAKNIVALHRDTGQVVWYTAIKRGYASLLLDGDRLIVSINGYIWCLNPLTGELLWHNPLTGMGMSVASITSVRGGKSADEMLIRAAESDDAASSSSSTNTGASTGM